MAVRLEPGNCLEVMRRLAEEGVRVDAIVTDPPYHLTSIVKRFGKEGSAPAKSNGETGVYARASSGFMGKAWDGGDVAFNSVTWGTAASLLKPGGWLLAFGGTRTYGRLQWAIEGGGFEVRDTIAWMFGQGFPKSHNLKGEWEGFGTALKPAMELVCVARKPLSEGSVAANVLKHGTGALNIDATRVPTSQGGAHNNHGGSTSDTSSERGFCPKCDTEHSGSQASADGGLARHNDQRANESERVRRNRQSQGSLDDCPICPRCGGELALADPTDGQGFAQQQGGAHSIPGPDAEGGHSREGLSNSLKDNTARHVERQGRWPSNVVHDGSPEVEAAFAAFGDRASCMSPSTAKSEGSIFGGSRSQGNLPGDTGTASRFFYTSKADKHDRWGSKHPTVKPIDLMRWLVRLATPPGGTVLDPFAGSGTTGIAAMAEGFDCILIEREEEYLADIRERLAFYEGDGRHSLAAKNRKREAGHDDLPLFSK